MHELGVTQAILDIVLRHSGGAPVRNVQVTVGGWTGYVGDSIELFWQELSRGTAAEGAKLAFRYEPATLRCRACGAVFGASGTGLHCPECGVLGGEPAGGQECVVEAIEVEGGEAEQ